jgi:hypothetical protein
LYIQRLKMHKNSQSSFVGVKASLLPRERFVLLIALKSVVVNVHQEVA